MLGDISGISKIYCITGRTDMRRSIDGLMAIIRDTYQMDPYANALYLFCGRRRNTLKALYFDKDGFCLLYKRLSFEFYLIPLNEVHINEQMFEKNRVIIIDIM